jgi:hypothetical protein
MRAMAYSLEMIFNNILSLLASSRKRNIEVKSYGVPSDELGVRPSVYLLIHGEDGSDLAMIL